MKSLPKLLVAATLAIGCATGPKVVEPEFNIRIVEIPEALPVYANPFATLVEIDVVNRSHEPLVLRKIDVSSVGQSRYTVIPVSQNFNRTIAPQQNELFPVRVQVIAEETIGMAEEPIHIRGVLFFETPAGDYRRTFMQRVNPSTIR